MQQLRLDARQRYLAIAAALGASQPARHFAVSHVTIGAVANAAGVSRGALYRLWPSQQDYWNDLIDFLVECRAPAGHFGRGFARVEPTTRDEPISDAAQHVLLADPLTVLRTATAGEPGTGTVGARVAGHRVARLAELGDALDRWAQSNGRTCIPGVAPADVAAAVTALGTGIPIVGRMSPPEDLRFESPWFERSPRDPRSMLGVATEAVRECFTAPGQSPAQAGPTIPAAEPLPAPPAGKRRSYLEIGAELAVTRAGTASHRVLGHVTLDSVARAAGVSRRAIANVWHDQDAFRLDLFAHLLADDRATVIVSVRTATLTTAARSGGALATVGEHMYRHLLAAHDEVTYRSFATQLDDPFVASRAMNEHRRLADACAMQVRRLLAVTNRRLRPGVVGRQVATALFGLNDGFATLLRAHPQAIRDDIDLGDGGGPHSTVGLTVQAVLGALTEPLDGRADVERFVALIS